MYTINAYYHGLVIFNHFLVVTVYNLVINLQSKVTLLNVLLKQFVD